MRSSGDDNVNNGADSCSNQLHIAIVRISMVISGLEKLTVETPDQPGWISVCSFFISDNYYTAHLHMTDIQADIEYGQNRGQNIRKVYAR